MIDDTTMLPMGEGPIDPERIPEEMRVLRHNFRNLKAAQNLATSMLLEVMKSASEAKAHAVSAMDTAKDALATAQATNYDLYGHPDRKDDRGALGEIRDSLKRQTQQNWAILFAILALIGTMVVAVMHGA